MSDKKDTMTGAEEDGGIEIVEVEQLPSGETPKADEEDDTRSEAKADTPDEDDDEDERLGEGPENADEDEATSRNRQRRQQRNKVRKEARDRSERELAALRSRNDALEQRLQAIEGKTYTAEADKIARNKEEAELKLRQAEMVMARALAANQPEDVVEAIRIRDAAKDELRDLQSRQSDFDTERRQAETPRVDRRVVDYAKQWTSANPWFDPNGSDEDSRITAAIDNGLAREGYDPTTPDYWVELTKRVGSRIGGREETGDTPPRRRVTPTGQTREHAPQTTRNQVYVTPERKQAMVDAGYWDDPVKRTQMLKRYAEHDKAPR